MTNLPAGHDTFVLMPTGGGKSLCYQLPALLMDGTAIVISPLIALMKNQVDAMRNFSEDNAIAHFLNSSLNKADILAVKADITSGKTKMLYVQPESLTKEENIEFLKSVKISFYAIDEAHCISEWGHDFRPEYRRIRPIINEIGTRPVIALTATATPKSTARHTEKPGNVRCCSLQVIFQPCEPLLRGKAENRQYRSRHNKVHKSKRRKIRHYLLPSRKKVGELAEMLQVNNIKALAYHAGMDSTTRSENQDAFLMEKWM